VQTKDKHEMTEEEDLAFQSRVNSIVNSASISPTGVLAHEIQRMILQVAEHYISKESWKRYTANTPGYRGGASGSASGQPTGLHTTASPSKPTGRFSVGPHGQPITHIVTAPNLNQTANQYSTPPRGADFTSDGTRVFDTRGAHTGGGLFMASQDQGARNTIQPVSPKLQQTGGQGNENWSANIADVMRNQFGLKPKEQSYAYQRPYPAWFDQVAMPHQFKVPDFAKFSREDNMSTREHASRFLCGETATIDA
jgi:hypothetical protein